MVKADNDRRQQEMNENGLDPGRSLNVHSYIVTISLCRVADLFSRYSSLSPASLIHNMS